MDDLAERLHSIANHPCLPADACVDVHEAAVKLVSLAYQVRAQRNIIKELLNEEQEI